MTPEQRKSRLRDFKDQIIKLRQEAAKLELECPHQIEPQEPDEEHGCGYAVCAGCFKDFGWYCPTSPDHVCHYHSENGMVEQIAGPDVPIPAAHNPQYETSDQCIFCGHPDERK